MYIFIVADGFVVSDEHEAPHELCGKPVCHLSQLSCTEDIIFLLGLSSLYAAEVRQQLRSSGTRNIYWPIYMRFLTEQEKVLERSKNKLLRKVHPLLDEEEKMSTLNQIKLHTNTCPPPPKNKWLISVRRIPIYSGLRKTIYLEARYA